MSVWDKLPGKHTRPVGMRLRYVCPIATQKARMDMSLRLWLARRSLPLITNRV